MIATLPVTRKALTAATTKRTVIGTAAVTAITKKDDPPRGRTPTRLSTRRRPNRRKPHAGGHEGENVGNPFAVAPRLGPGRKRNWWLARSPLTNPRGNCRALAAQAHGQRLGRSCTRFRAVLSCAGEANRAVQPSWPGTNRTQIPPILVVSGLPPPDACACVCHGNCSQL